MHSDRRLPGLELQLDLYQFQVLLCSLLPHPFPYQASHRPYTVQDEGVYYVQYGLGLKQGLPYIPPLPGEAYSCSHYLLPARK